MVPIVCSAMGLVGLLSVIALIIWHKRKRHKRLNRHDTQRLEQKSNNENEETLRRYRNPLFDTDKGGGKSASTELLEIDIEKYEKSPRRVIGRTDSDPKNNTPLFKSNKKKKDINIEISRTLTSDHEVIV